MRSGLTGLTSATWDTWSLHYESDGINQDSSVDTDTDEGANGFDDDGINGVDDPGERETSPPYNVPLRGLQVRLRIMETDTLESFIEKRRPQEARQLSSDIDLAHLVQVVQQSSLRKGEEHIAGSAICGPSRLSSRFLM